MCEVNGILMVFGRPIVLLLSCASTDANEERECVSYCEVEYEPLIYRAKSPSQMNKKSGKIESFVITRVRVSSVSSSKCF